MQAKNLHPDILIGILMAFPGAITADALLSKNLLTSGDRNGS